MRVKVNAEKCEGHNRCCALAPELFDVDDYGTAMALNDGEVPAELEAKAKLAVENCPEFAISIGLVVDRRPVVGVVHNPITNLTVSGRLGHGVLKNGEPTGLSDCAALTRARVVVSRREKEDGMLEPYAPLFGVLRPMGSIALKLALVACGEADFNISVKPKSEWDVCAGDLLVHEAGGEYVDFTGQVLPYNQPDTLREASMIAGSPGLIEEFSASFLAARS